MQRIVTVGLLVSLCAAPIFAAGPIETSARQAAQAVPQPRDLEVTNDGANALIWAGTGMFAGGILLEVLSMTAMKQGSSGCVFGYFDYICASETHTNKPVLFVGMGVGVAGGLMMDMGFRHKRRAHPSIDFGAGRVRIAQTFKF